MIQLINCSETDMNQYKKDSSERGKNYVHNE